MHIKMVCFIVWFLRTDMKIWDRLCFYVICVAHVKLIKVVFACLAILQL